MFIVWTFKKKRETKRRTQFVLTKMTFIKKNNKILFSLQLMSSSGESLPQLKTQIAPQWLGVCIACILRGRAQHSSAQHSCKARLCHISSPPICHSVLVASFHRAVKELPLSDPLRKMNNHRKSHVGVFVTDKKPHQWCNAAFSSFPVGEQESPVVSQIQISTFFSSVAGKNVWKQCSACLKCLQCTKHFCQNQLLFTPTELPASDTQYKIHLFCKITHCALPC